MIFSYISNKCLIGFSCLFHVSCVSLRCLWGAATDRRHHHRCGRVVLLLFGLTLCAEPHSVDVHRVELVSLW